MTAIMISTFSVRDVDKFKTYMQKTQQVAGVHGAEMMFRGVLNRALNGDTSGSDRVVIAKFPDVGALNDWFDSPEYQALVPLREEAADMTMLSFDAAT